MKTVREILEAYRKDCQRTDDYVEGGVHLSIDQALSQLESLFAECKPDRFSRGGSHTPFGAGYKIALGEYHTNLTARLGKESSHEK